MSELQRRAHSVLGGDRPPDTLWVVHNDASRVMSHDHREPHLDLGDHYDWLLAAGPDRLGLVRVRGPILTADDLVFASPYEELQVELADVGAMTRHRVITVTRPEHQWFAVMANLRSGREARVNAFTEMLEQLTSD